MDVYGAIGLFSDAELTDLERAAVSLIVSGFTYSEIAEQLNCPAKRVDNAVQRARRKLWRSMRS
jgi:DNA-directed RNA polymerase specialized sigma24 family protein